MLKMLICLFISLSFLGDVYAEGVMSKQADTFYDEALKLQEAYNFTGANALYQKILYIDPTNSKWPVLILNNRGVMFAQQDDLVSAELFFLKALEVDPKSIPPKFNLGLIYEKQGKELESIKYWLKASNIDLDKIRPSGYVLGKAQKSRN